MLLDKIVDKIVYSRTKKPRYYKEVKRPPVSPLGKLLRMQDARQVQYNRWSRRFKVYSGSYLPEDKNRLLKKGWVDETDKVIKNNKSTNPSRFYRRKKTNQWVRNDVDHWHWSNWWKRVFDSKAIKQQTYQYYDEYGELCKRNSPESHIKGKD